MTFLTENWFFLAVVLLAIAVQFLHFRRAGSTLGGQGSPDEPEHTSGTRQRQNGSDRDESRGAGGARSARPMHPPRTGCEVLNTRVWMCALGCWAGFSFVLCVLWGLATPQALHMHGFLESILPGFHWLSFGSFVAGLIESFLYGAYAGLLLAPLHNFFWRRWANGGPEEEGA